MPCALPVLWDLPTSDSHLGEGQSEPQNADAIYIRTPNAIPMAQHLTTGT